MNIGRILVHLKSTGSHLALPGPFLGPMSYCGVLLALLLLGLAGLSWTN